MNDDIVVQKILKLLENNTAFIGYALNGGIGTKINVRNTETGKTIQALSINVDSSGEVLVVKDSDDGKYKAVTFKAAQQTTERIIQIRKTKPIDDKKIIDYTDSDIEVFYLFVKLIDTGSPVDTQLQSTWIRKGSSCTQFVGAYERCNYASKATIGGISYTGLPYVPYSTLNDCLNDDLGRDAKTPHGTGDEQGGNAGWKYFSTQVSASGEEAMLAALTSHDSYYKTNYKSLFGYATILECSGAMNLQGWEAVQVTDPITNEIKYILRCEFSYLPGYTTDCTPAMQAAGYCDTRGFISSKCPQYGQEAPGQPGIGNIDSTWNSLYGWEDLPYEFMYKRHFGQLYLNGSTAPGSFYILEVNDDQVPGNLPPGYSPWVPGCPSNLGDGGPYNGGGGNRNPEGSPKVKKRDMKLSTHKAEIWLGSSKKEEAIKLYELGVSDLFSGMYNSFIVRADETQVDIEKRLNRNYTTTEQDNFIHNKFYENCNKNIIDQRIDPKMWVYIMNNVPKIQSGIGYLTGMPFNLSLNLFTHHLYNKTINLTVVDKKTQIVHLKIGVLPANTLSNTDCKGVTSYTGSSYNGIPTDYAATQVWQYQKNITIKVKNWEIESSTSGINTTEISDSWNKDYISRNYLTMFRKASRQNQSNVMYNYRNRAGLFLLRPNNNSNIEELYLGNHFEQFNYSLANLGNNSGATYLPYRYGATLFYDSEIVVNNSNTQADNSRFIGFSTTSWWELWDKTVYDKKNKRLNTIVGYDVNLNEIYTDWGLPPSLSNEYGIFFKYFDYISQGDSSIIVPSLIRRIRLNTLSINQSNVYSHLKDRKSILEQTGTNFFFSDGYYRWTDVYPFLLNGQHVSTPSYSSTKQLLTQQARGTYTRETGPMARDSATTSNTIPDDRLETHSWKNKLWAQIIYTGETKVDVDSYRNVEFNLPTNPSQYIKFASSSTYKNSEYSFVDSGQQQPRISLETVLTPGVLDVTKQVPIKKPTNVELDPNMSFLLYIYPFVEVTKKTKEI